jgi:chemotaxis protein methyltransferase CheR
VLTVSVKALQQLAALLLERAGLKINPDGYHSLRLALNTRMPVVGLEDAEEYVRRLRGPAGEGELRSLLPLVTVGHTEFFRDAKQFRALQKRILPDMLQRARRELRKVFIWSAGCATGEEPYSLAMVLVELGAISLEVDLWATDLNLAAVEAAKQGRFVARRLAGMGAERLERFFRPAEEGYEVVPSLKEYVRFDGQNLAAPVFERVKPASLDLILCRNVIIYFDLPTIRALMDRFLNALRPGGLLLLGYSESLFKVYDRFEMVDVEGAFVYRRPMPAAVWNGSEAQPPAAAQASPERPPSRMSVTGLAAVQAPAERPLRTSVIGMPAVLAARGPDPASEPPGVAPATAAPQAAAPTLARSTSEGAPPEPARARTQDLPPWRLPLSPAERLNVVGRMMERGDFVGAQAAVEQLLVDEPGHLDALLTLGNLHSLSSRLAEAREAYSQALAREPLCVEARVFAGLAALQASELAEARSELGKALFLEPTLAVGHYLIAQVYERLQDFEQARRCYRNAISQLRYPQRPLAGHYPDLPELPDTLGRAARYALAALEEEPSP